jgi:hypothetical protein
MDTSDIILLIDAEISRLQQEKALFDSDIGAHAGQTQTRAAARCIREQKRTQL